MESKKKKKKPSFASLALPPHIKRNFVYAKIYRKVRYYKSNADFVIIGEPGCQPKGSKVLMASGQWKKIEQIKIGDKIISPQTNGKNIFSKVTNTQTWHSKENYNIIELNRTKKKLYTCSYNHLIPTHYYCYDRPTINGKRMDLNRRWEIRNYEAQTFSKMSNERKSHQNIGFSSFEIKNFKDKKNYFIDGYTLGVVLGDGHFSSKLKYCPSKKVKGNMVRSLRNKLSITSNDSKIIEKVKAKYPIQNDFSKQNTTARSYCFSPNGKLFKDLLKTGLVNKKSGDKFIPKGAKLSDSNYRKELLAGLIDTDGCYTNGGYEITTKSERLATDIINLVYSLGGRGRVRTTFKACQNWVRKRKYFCAAFYLNDMRLPLVLDRRKKKSSSVYLASNRIAINSVLTKPSQVYGFSLDSPSQLYITDNWMVTHNTGKSSLAQRIGYDVDPKFNLQRIVYSVVELMKLLRYGEVIGENPDGTKKFKRLPIGSVIIFDETAGSEEGADSRSSLSKVNKTMSYIKTIYRAYRYIVLYVAPSLSQIDKNVKLVATSGVFWTKRIDPLRKSICTTFYWSKSNLLMGKQYNKKPMIVSPFNRAIFGIKHIWFPFSPKDIFVAYEAKKKDFMDSKMEGWLEVHKPVVAKHKSTFEEHFNKAKSLGNELKLEGKYDWGLVAAKLGVNATIAGKITTMLTKGAEL